jgi:hypothetical protein
MQKNWIVTLILKNIVILFSENWPKSTKIVIVTLTPGAQEHNFIFVIFRQIIKEKNLDGKKFMSWFSNFGSCQKTRTPSATSSSPAPNFWQIKKGGKHLRRILNFAPRGKLWPPGAKLFTGVNFVHRGEVIPWGRGWNPLFAPLFF